jgi:hypothetical protein
VSYEASVLGWCSNDPGNPWLAEAWFVRSRWERGRCPCCGLAVSGSRQRPVRAVAEGVELCGFCARPEHCPDDPLRHGLLRALAQAPPHCPG